MPLVLKMIVSFLPIKNSFISLSYSKNVDFSVKFLILIFRMELLGTLSLASFSFF